MCNVFYGFTKLLVLFYMTHDKIFDQLRSSLGKYFMLASLFFLYYRRRFTTLWFLFELFFTRSRYSSFEILILSVFSSKFVYLSRRNRNLSFWVVVVFPRFPFYFGCYFTLVKRVIIIIINRPFYIYY